MHIIFPFWRQKTQGIFEKDPAANVSSADSKGEATPAKQRKLDFTKPVAQSITQTQLNRLIAGYVVEDMQPNGLVPCFQRTG